MGEAIQRVTVRVKKEYANELKKIAIDEDTNVSEILRKCIKRTVEKRSLNE